ncbi:family 16 glycoside hydrolase [Enterovirga sp. CN4-39]|uniref:family 16 glycoside hydrolase n=1 Tax=Enterovirga sp. CN4-39 TaxID=3400910 RepID=UPI003C0E5D79
MATITDPMLDYIATRGSENRVVDLATMFSGTSLTYTVQSSDPSVAAAAIQGGKLVIDYADALGHTDLKITATDALGHSVTDNVRVRVAGENAYTIAVLPDTQDYTNAARVEIFKNMTNWLVDNKDSLDIQFVIHVGDITTNNSDASHWPYAEEALRILDGKIPYSLLPGNHDQNTGNAANHSTNPLDIRFSPEKQAATNPGTFGGVYDQEPNRSANNYHTFTAPDGTKWLVLSLEFGPRDDVLRWAGEVIEAHLDHRVILANHSYMNWAGRHDATGAPLYDEGTGYDYGMGSSVHGANDGETMYRELIQKYSNVSFTFSGHIFGDGAETLVSYDQFGNPVHQMMVNYQNGVASEITSDAGQGSGGNGGNGAIRLLTIDPDNNAVYTSTYFTELDDHLDSVRGDGEFDRDGLTGPYRGHQETITGVDMGTPDLFAIAKAGNDQFVTAEAGEGTASVTLDGDWTLNPGNDQGLSYSWTDRDGNVVATGASPTLDLAAGQHQLTLTVTDSDGNVSTDDVRLVVSTDRTLLVDNFNDGNAQGWGTTSLGPQYTTRTTSQYGIAPLPNGDQPADAAVTYLPKLGQVDGGVLVKLDVPTGTVARNYSLVYDLLVTPGVQSYFSFLQTDLANTSDQDLALKNVNGSRGGIGINSDYEGTVNYGQWHRIAFTITDRGDNVLIDKYIDGVKVGDTVQSGGNYGRYQFDMSKGFLLFADESGETWPGYASSFLFTDKILTAAEIAALGGVKAGGIMDTKPTENSVQIDFSTPAWTDEFGEGSARSVTIGNSGTGTFIVKGTAAARSTVEEGQDAPEGRVYEQSDSASKVLVWTGNGAASWTDYEYEATLKSTDNDTTGVVFYYKDASNYYRLVLDGETNTRSLIKVQNGVESVLARESGGMPWSRDFQVKVVVSGNEISALLDGSVLFADVVDSAPLAGGSVGFYSHNQRSSQFDNVTVNKIAVTAHAGDDLRPVDTDGDGRVSVELDAGGSYGLADIVSYIWTDADGNVVAQGESTLVTLDAVKQTLTLTVTDAQGRTATDTVVVDAISIDRVLLSEGFGGGDFAAWTIVDEGESGGVGPNGTASQWELQDGALVQLSDLKSRQLTWSGASNSNPWQTGWSPLGDGVNVLRKGTYALYNDPAAKGWSDYAVQATIETPDNGALGLLFYYQDQENYYKLELDANGVYDRSPGNGAGSLFQLIQVKDGVERYLNQYPAKYTPNEAFELRIEVLDGRIQAYVDGLALFGYAIEDRAQTKGTIGLFSWDSAGVSFDDVIVYDLASESTLPEGGEIVGTPFDDMLSGTVGDDVILAGLGDDTVLALGGKDEVDGGEGDDSLDGGEGDDTLRGAAGDDQLIGGAGNDLLIGGAGDDLLDGGEGVDTADYSTDTAGVSVDLASGEAYGDEAGSDELVDIEKVIGGSGDDILIGDGGANRLIGGAGNDALRGGAGDDILQGGAGDDTINGGEGFDILDLADATGSVSVDVAAGRASGAGIGTDTFTGIERLVLGAGDDVVTGGNGVENIDGGAGNDTLKGAGGDDLLDGGAGDDLIDAGSGDDVVTGGTGVDTIKAGSGDDRIDAGEGDDVVDAGSGADIILAGAGNDVADGGSGDDRIEGGAGDDILTGGSGHDTFVFAASFGRDTITDFRTSGSSSDVLEFATRIFADLDAAMAAAGQVGADTVFTLDADSTLTLSNVQLASLAADDFRFV